MSRRKAMAAFCGHTNRGPKPRKDWSDVVGRCGAGERARIERSRARWFVALSSKPITYWVETDDD